MDSLLAGRHPIGVEFAEDDVIVKLSDGTKISNPLAWHFWLKQASLAQQVNAVFGPYSIDWPDLDEGLDIEGMLRGIKPKQPRSVTE